VSGGTLLQKWMLGQVSPRGPFESNFFYESLCAGMMSGSEVKASMGIRKANEGSECLIQTQLSKWSGTTLILYFLRHHNDLFIAQ